VQFVARVLMRFASWLLIVKFAFLTAAGTTPARADTPFSHIESGFPHEEKTSQPAVADASEIPLEAGAVAPVAREAPDSQPVASEPAFAPPEYAGEGGWT